MSTSAEPAGTPLAASRAERRRRGEQAVLSAARELFRRDGYDATTVRAIATRAGVDASLVMRWFTSKESLFTRAVIEQFQLRGAQWQDEGGTGGDTGEGLGERMLLDFLHALEDTGGSALHVVRAMLTHEQAWSTLRAAFLADPDRDPMVVAIPGEEAQLKAALLGSIVLGIGIGRHVLRFPPLEEASPEHIATVIAPALHELLAPPRRPEGDTEG
ncbi:TetR family transcriptional regulator [Kitasatospora sp. NPDC088264]|uniref:TetR/AcrR family transcriptional regulator n=1 Tax=unclassified Kitasatospora TaxID=2633591 RepID=UPI0034137DC6